MAVLRTVLTLMIGVGILSSAAQAEPPEEKPGQRTDRYGDPLPEGAIARIGTVRLRHAGAVTAVAFSPDSKRLVSTGEDGTVRLWDVVSGQELRQFRQNQSRGCSSVSIAFTRDGKAVAAKADGEMVRFWDADSGKCLRTFPVGPRWVVVTAFALSPDGTLLAVNESNVRIVLWDVATGKERGRLEGGYEQLAFSPDGTVLADSAGNLWAVSPGENVPQLAKNPEDTIVGVAFAPQGKSLATVGRGPRAVIRLWDVASGEELSRWNSSQPGVRSLAFSPDGEHLASGSYGTKISLWAPATGKEVRQLQGHRGGVENVLFSPDGKLLASWGAEGRISIWDVAKSALLHSFHRTEDPLSCIAIAPDGNSLACGKDKTICLHEPSTGRLLRQLEGHRSVVRSLAFTPNAGVLVSGGDDQTTRLWEVSTGKAVAKFDDKGGRVAISPDGATLASGGIEFCLRELASGRELLRFHQEDHVSRGLAFSADGRFLASAAEEGNSYLFEVETGRRICHYGQSGGVYPVCAHAFSPNGTALAAVQPRLGLSLRLVDRVTAKEHDFDRGHELFGRSVAFSPDSAKLAIGDVEGMIHFWDPSIGQDHDRLTADAGTVLAVVFSSDGRRLASLHEDGTALVWDLASRSAKRTAPPPLTPERREALWKELDHADDFVVYRAMCVLAASEQSVQFLHDRLKAIGILISRIEQLVTDLDDEVFATREKATKELTQVAELAEPILRKALAEGLPLEANRRAEKVLRRLEQRVAATAPTDLQRAKRAVRVLEQNGTTSARQVLETLAKDPVMNWLSQDASASLERLARRAGK